MTLKGIDNDIFHIIFLWTSDKDVMSWYYNIGLEKVMNLDDMCKEFLCQYSHNADLPITLRDLKLIQQEENESFSDFFARWRVNATYMPNQPLEADQVR